MKKVININFHGRVIPIEETAYELLKQYIDSLRKYFVNEEGREEIVNDIEGRIAELFSEKLKNGITCITDADVNSIIADMGRPEDFDAQDVEIPTATTKATSGAPYNKQQPPVRGSLYRNADDKILAGVCSGLANYLNIDPVIMRIIFVLLFGVLFWVYILLWIIVPSKSVESNITKRLYRNPDQKIIAGVCGGIASYFNIGVWIPRLIFALPFILGLISGSFHAFWWDWDFGWMPRIISGSFGWTLFLTYVILWISVPFANTTSEKLEMRGERVDLNSIRNTVKEDLENFKSRAEKFGGEIKTSAKQFGEQASAQARTMAADAGPAARRTASGLGHAIGVLFKAFFIFIFAIIAISLFGVFVALLFGGVALAPLKAFVLEGPIQNLLAWLTLFLFFMIPLIAFVTWGIRRLVGARSKKHYVGITFMGLWIIGLISGIVLVTMIARNFKNNISLKEEQVIVTTKDRLVVDVEGAEWKNYNHHFFGMDVDGDDLPFYDINEDSVFINTVKLSMVKSQDSSFHVYRIKSSRGSDAGKANRSAQNIEFNIEQRDSMVVLPRGFNISREDKFRNQRIWVVIEVPVNKKIAFTEKIGNYNWFNVRSGATGFEVTDDDFNDRDNLIRPQPGREYRVDKDGRFQKIDSN
jgi:phage shock protein PspC (stress-responsive transcriptional regulator)